jgi:hypothetical protein
VNAFLVDALDTAARVYVYSCGHFPASEMEEAKPSISNLLCREISLFICDKNINPMGYFCFHHVNFRCFNRQEDEIGHNGEHWHYMPTEKFQEMVTAFAMGRHVRLGSDGCVVSILSNELLRLIFSYEIF